MIIAETPRLVVRNWRDEDLDLFHEINSDPEVMRFFPLRRNCDESRALMNRLQRQITETGFGFFAAEQRSDRQPIGFVGLAVVNIAPLFPPGTVEIGWRLATRFWGTGYATEAASELLRVGFEQRKLNEIVSFAVADNHRSTAVMERIGMRRNATRDFDHPEVPDSHPHLKRHVLYGVTAEQWRARAPQGGPERR